MSIRMLAAGLSLWMFAGCEYPDLCRLAPTCEENRATNCDYSCSGCSGSPDLRECGTATCQVLAGDPTSPAFFRDRAACVVPGSGDCDPQTAGAPTCQDGVIRGCSAYRKVVEANCARADRYFEDTTCCGLPQGGDDGGTDGGP